MVFLRCVCRLLLLFCLGGLTAAWAQVPVPALKARVTDLTGTLSESQRQSLESRLAAFERDKGAQVGVLLVPTVRPESIEQYGIRVGEAWKLGRKGVDDGLILLVAKNDREVRIEVGYGLEGAVPDVVAKRIIEEAIVPRFRAGDMAGGIGAGVERLLAVIGGEPLPAPTASSAGTGDGLNVDLLFPIFMIAVVAGNVLRALFGRLLAAGASGGVAALAAGLMGASLFGVAGIGIVVFCFILVGGSGFIGGGSGGGGGWSGGGGFSGGGGGFGGGGASGRW